MSGKLKMVYVLQGDDKCKIGIAINPESRLYDIQAHSFEKYSLIYSSHETADARFIERIAHRLLKDFRIKGEWFKVDGETAKQAVIKAIELNSKEEGKLILAPKKYTYNRVGFSLSKSDEEKLNAIRLDYEAKHNVRLPLSEMLRIMIKEYYHFNIKSSS